MIALLRTFGLSGKRAATALALGLLFFLVLAVSHANAQEGAISPPPPLQWPAQAGANANSDFSITLLRRQIELGGNTELCKILMTEAKQPIPANFTWSLCPPDFQAKVNARDGKVSWASGAKPTECGTNCVGRPFMTQSTSLDRPNTIYAMLYGHLDYAIDVPGPFNRDVTYGYEAQFRCLLDPGARQGDLDIRMVFEPPVVDDPGILESITNFLILPADLSRRIEEGIRSQLSTPGSQSQSLGRCTSIGVNTAAEPSFDSILFNRPASRPTVRVPIADTALRSTVTVHFFRITRKPVFGYTPPADPGQFTVYLNGAPAHFPGTPALNLPVAGGSAAINFCKTIDMTGADRVQLIFANSLGGAVWSQFAANANYGAGPVRTMTTGRTVVVPGLPGPPDPVTGKPGPTKPQPIVLNEFELLYTIEYHGQPGLVAVAPPVTGGGTRPGRLGPILTAPGATLSTGSSGPAQPCRQI